MTDALVSALANDGYQPVFLPRTGFTPPDLYTYKAGSLVALKPRARLVRHGPLADYVTSGDTTFRLEHGEAASIKGKHTSSKKSSASVDFLSKALACLGVPSLPKGKAKIELGHEFLFSFENVTFARVDLSQLEKEEFLARLSLKGIPKKQVEAGGVHVVYEYLYARSLKMARSDQGRFEADVAGKIGEWLKLGDAKVTVAVRDESVISFDAKRGVEPPSFAYRSAQIQQSGGMLTVNPHVVMAGPEGEIRERYVPHPGGPVEVETK